MGLKVELKVLIDESVIPAICDKQFTNNFIFNYVFQKLQEYTSTSSF